MTTRTTRPTAPAGCTADGRQGPISPTVVSFAPQADVYRLPRPNRLAVADEMSQTRGVTPGGAPSAAEAARTTVDQLSIWCVPDDAAWQALCAAHAAAQHTLQALAQAFRRLGRYDQRLLAAGGVEVAPNPLTSNVIAALDPDAPPRGHGALAAVPPFVRCAVRVHTPKMLYVQVWGRRWSRGAQQQFFVCPTDDDWHTIQLAQQAAATACGAFRATMDALGRSSHAHTDARSTPGRRCPVDEDGTSTP